jgi:predicted site-specific integrase-resolvase
MTTMTGPPEPPVLPLLMTAEEVMDLLHISSSTLQTWRERGVIDGHQLADGRSWRYPSRQPAIQDALAAAYAYAGGAR